MKPRTAITLLTICLVIVGLFVWGSANRSSSAASIQGVGGSSSVKGLLSASSEKLYDFGTISMKDGNVTKDFSFTNSTSTDVVIRGLETSCMCTSALLVEPDGSTKGPFGMAGMGGLTTTSDTVKAGESRTLRVIYNPNAHGPAGVGSIDRFITVTESSGSQLVFEIRAVVTP